MKQLQVVMPAEFSRMDTDEAVVLLDRLTDEAVSGGVRSCRWRPGVAALPASLKRELEASIYTRPDRQVRVACVAEPGEASGGDAQRRSRRTDA